MPSALGLWAYISDKSLVPMLQLLHVSQSKLRCLCAKLIYYNTMASQRSHVARDSSLRGTYKNMYKFKVTLNPPYTLQL